jgi:hypothetical protein
LVVPYIAQTVSRRLPARLSGFYPVSGHVGFVLNRVELGQVFPANSQSAKCSVLIYLPGLVQ